MKIACLGWGSLLWKHGVLPVVGEWHADGPVLPIEFARESDGGELATVICESAAEQTSWWAMLSTGDVGEARELLRQREEVDTHHPDWIGDTESDTAYPHRASILEWAAAKGIDAVVWTALPPRCDGVEGRAPDPQTAASYLGRLTGSEREHAEAYVRRVPAAISTRNRAAIESGLGWTPEPFI